MNHQDVQSLDSMAGVHEFRVEETVAWMRLCMWCLVPEQTEYSLKLEQDGAAGCAQGNGPVLAAVACSKDFADASDGRNIARSC